MTTNAASPSVPSPIYERSEALDLARTIVRHPRSLIRPHPDWIPPSLSFSTPAGPCTLIIARRRLTEEQWLALTGLPAPLDEALHLVTISAFLPATEGDAEAGAHSVQAIYRDLLGRNAPWQQFDRYGEITTDLNVARFSPLPLSDAGIRLWTMHAAVEDSALRDPRFRLAAATATVAQDASAPTAEDQARLPRPLSQAGTDRVLIGSGRDRRRHRRWSHRPRSRHPHSFRSERRGDGRASA